jgi:hypothetical protein
MKQQVGILEVDAAVGEEADFWAGNITSSFSTAWRKPLPVSFESASLRVQNAKKALI